MLQVDVLALNQRLDFQTRAVLNVLVLRLPNGRQVELSVADDLAQEFVSCLLLAAPGAPVLHEPPQQVGDSFETVEQDGVEQKVFGGTPPPPVRQRRAVSVDEMGNPVVEGMTSLGDITGGDNFDEDGVGSI